MIAIIFRKSASLTGCGGRDAISEPTAGSMRGKLMVCGPTPNLLFEMANVLHHRENFEAPVVEPEQHPDADIVDARFHRSVEGRSLRQS